MTPAPTASDPSHAVVTYTPPQDYAGPDSFTYMISDGHGGTASASVSITISAPTELPPVSFAVAQQNVIINPTVNRARNFFWCRRTNFCIEVNMEVVCCQLSVVSCWECILMWK